MRFAGKGSLKGNHNVFSIRRHDERVEAQRRQQEWIREQESRIAAEMARAAAENLKRQDDLRRANHLKQRPKGTPRKIL
jgi:hypothetical protein